MAEILETIIDENGNTIFNIDARDGEKITLATADTYVDKNICFNIVNDSYVKTIGDTMTGPLKFKTKTLPILDLHIDSTNSSNVYSMTTNGSLFIGDATSNGGARVYFARNIPQLNTALLTSVSIGYNPKDQLNWSNSTDYGIKFDVNVASNTVATPSATRQSASFFVGLNGAYIGYSGSHLMPLTQDKIYRILDSNSIKEDAYILSLEARITDLEAKIIKLEELLNKEDNNDVL